MLIMNLTIHLQSTIITYGYIVTLFLIILLLIFTAIQIIKYIVRRRLIKKMNHKQITRLVSGHSIIFIEKIFPFYWLGACLVPLRRKSMQAKLNPAQLAQFLSNLLLNNLINTTFMSVIRTSEPQVIYFLGVATSCRSKRKLLSKLRIFQESSYDLLDASGFDVVEMQHISNIIQDLADNYLSLSISVKRRAEIDISANKIRETYSYIKTIVENTIIKSKSEVMFSIFFYSSKIRPNCKKLSNNNRLNIDNCASKFKIGTNISYSFKPFSSKINKTHFNRIIDNLSVLKKSLNTIVNFLVSYNAEKKDNFIKNNKQLILNKKIKLRSFTEILMSEPSFFFEINSSDELVEHVSNAMSLFETLKVFNIPMPQLLVDDRFSTGEIFVGYQLINEKESIPFKLSIDDIRRHIVITGPSGKGKTRLARLIIKELLERFGNQIKIWVFDFHGEYLDLVTKNDFKLVVPGDKDSPLAINLFDPYNENPKTYSTFITNIFEETLRSLENPLTPQMIRIISMAISDTIIHSNERTPEFFVINLWKWSQELSNEIPTALQSFHAIINRIESLFSGVMGTIFWVKKSNINPKTLTKQNVIFNLSNLTRYGALKKDLVILVNVILRYVINEITKSNVLNKEIPNLFLVIEEGRYVVPWRKKDDYSNTSTLEDLAILARKYGVTLCTISQSPSSISRDILENAGTFFALGGEAPNLEQDLYNNDIGRYMHIMPPQECIVRTTSRPALLRIKIRSIDLPIIDHSNYKNALEERNRDLLDNYFPIPVSFDDFIKQLLTGNSTDIKAIKNSYTRISEPSQINSTIDKGRIDLFHQPLKFLINLLKKESMEPATINPDYLNNIIKQLENKMHRKLSKREILELEYNLYQALEEIKNKIEGEL